MKKKKIIVERVEDSTVISLEYLYLHFREMDVSLLLLYLTIFRKCYSFFFFVKRNDYSGDIDDT